MGDFDLASFLFYVFFTVFILASAVAITAILLAFHMFANGDLYKRRVKILNSRKTDNNDQ